MNPITILQFHKRITVSKYPQLLLFAFEGQIKLSFSTRLQKPFVPPRNVYYKAFMPRSSRIISYAFHYYAPKNPPLISATGDLAAVLPEYPRLKFLLMFVLYLSSAYNNFRSIPS